MGTGPGGIYQLPGRAEKMLEVDKLLSISHIL